MNLTLYQLNNLVRQVIDYSLNEAYWVEAELAECRESGGHCYMDLVQTEDGYPAPSLRGRSTMLEKHMELCPS